MFSYSRKLPQASQIGELFLRFAPDADLFERAADRPVVAPPAGPLRRCRREEPRAQRPSDDLDDGARARAGAIVERNAPLLVAAVGGAVVEAPGLDGLGEQPLAGERVEDGLQDLAAAHDHALLCARLAGL